MNRTRLLPFLLGVVLTMPIAACAATPAQASPNQISIMQDDDQLVNGSASRADHALRVMASLGVDVWEHAYYLNYQNRRPDYIDAWWNTVDWGTVASRFASVG